MKLSILLPTYNERGNIIALIKSLEDNLKEHKKEMIIIDDNSPDGTGKLVNEFSKNNKDVKCIIRKGERGLASAFMRGINESSGDVLVFMDSDFSHNPKVIPKLLSHLDGYDIVFASRYIKGGKMVTDNKLQYVFSTIFNLFTKWVLSIPVLDSTNGFFVAKKKVFHNARLEKIFDGYGDFCFKLIYHLKKKAKMKEIPSIYEKRRKGESKTLAFKHGISYIIEVLKLRLGVK